MIWRACKPDRCRPRPGRRPRSWQSRPRSCAAVRPWRAHRPAAAHWRRIRGSAVSSDAAISFRAAFLAPLMGISPLSRWPPRMRIRSINPQFGALRPKTMLVARGVPRGQTEIGTDALCRPRWSALRRLGVFLKVFRVFDRFVTRRGRLRRLAPLQIGLQCRGQPFGGRFCHQDRTLPWNGLTPCSQPARPHEERAWVPNCALCEAVLTRIFYS